MCGYRGAYMHYMQFPPDRSQVVDVIETHISTVSELCSRSSMNNPVLVCGDFNQPRIVWCQSTEETQQSSTSPLTAASTALINGMDFLNLCQVNQQKNHLGRVLDLTFCPREHQYRSPASCRPTPPATYSLVVYEQQ